MKSAPLALAVAVAAIALSLLQDAYLTPFYHGWQYIVLMALLAAVLCNAALARRRKPLGLAFAGAAVLALAGLASGLFGPDTVEIARAPGTVAPIAQLHAAAFFGAVDAAALSEGSASIVLRRPGRAPIAVSPSRRAYIDGFVIARVTHPAAYIVARSASGDHLTITQPSGAFLSPVLLFASVQSINGKAYPFDTFALPAMHRIVRVLYDDARDAAQHPSLSRATAGKAAIIYSFSDEAGRSTGITSAASGEEVTVGATRLRATLGTYPELIIASAPYPWALIGGAALFVAGVGWELLRNRRSFLRRASDAASAA